MSMRTQGRWALGLFGVLYALLLYAEGAAPVQTAQPHCQLLLPSNSLSMRVTVNEYKSCSQLPGLNPPGYLWSSLSGIGPNFSLPNGLNAGYCSDLAGTILDNPLFGNVQYTVKLWSSIDPALPAELSQAGDNTIPWNKINYILNTYPATPNGAVNWLDIQAAIWEIVHGCQPLGPLFECVPERTNPFYFPFGTTSAVGPYGCQNDANGRADIPLVNQIVADAHANGDAFLPGPGQQVAVVQDILTCSGSSLCSMPFQVVFIPVPCCNGAIGDYVWNDRNRNGLQDDGDTGINGVTVQLQDSGGNVLETTLTSTGGPLNKPGYYQFSGLCAGAYRVVVEGNSAPLAGLTATSPRSNTGDDNGANDSNNPAGTTVTISEITTGVFTSNQTVDFGYFAPCDGDVGDSVWQDLNRNGLQDAAEVDAGINGVTVYLLDSHGQALPTVPPALTFTGGPANKPGYYQFSGLCAGSYRVAVEGSSAPLAGLTATSPLSNTGEDNIPNDSNHPAGTTVTILEMDPGVFTSNQTIDFGYFAPCDGEVGDSVWQDLNRNGLQDPLEADAGINGVTVRLLDNNGQAIPTVPPVLTFTGGPTSKPGYYQFSGLCAGTYQVAVDAAASALPLAGLTPTHPLSNTGDDTVPNDSNNPAGTTVTILETAPGVFPSNQTIDFGYFAPCDGTLGDYVWRDVNRNGLQDPAEADAGINGVTVALQALNGQVLATTTTLTGGPHNQPGYYQFSGQCAGEYKVAVVSSSAPLAGLAPTSPRSTNGNDGIANDSNEPTGTTVSLFEPFPGVFTANQTIDFGYLLGSLGDRIWHDVNGNGVQDSGEAGLNGWTVTISGATLPAGYFTTQLTTGDGTYTFPDLPGGTYLVCVTPQAGYIQTFDLDGLATPHCAVVLLAPGQERTDVDFGYRQLGSVGDRVWDDSNGNGVQDAGEFGLNGWLVTISGANLPAGSLPTQLTAGDGLYTFGNLPAGTYTVCVTPQAGYTPTFDLDGLGTPHCATATLAAGQHRTDVDFGYRQLGSLGDRVWYDANSNGIQEAGEAGLTGWTVTISGATLPAGYTTTQMTGANGLYTFLDVPAGTYTVCATPQAGYAPTFDLDGVGTPHCTTVTLAAGQHRTDVDFGYTLGSLGDRVWNDANGDGIQDAGEAGLAGWVVTISGATLPAGYTTNQITGANGLYTFLDLPAGTYTVCVTPQAGYTPTFDLDGLGTPHCATATLAAGQSRTDVDFGYRQLGNLGDRVWDDANGNGIQDAGEAGLTGWTVTISGATLPAGYTTTQLTGADGLYAFANLPAGTYTVCVTPQAGYTQTFDLDGLGTPHCATATLAVGENRTDVDFGYRQLGSLGDRVWNDANDNGIQDAGEAGLAGWTVTISGATLPAGYTTTQLTDANGLYAFLNLPAGTYTVCVTPQAGYTQTFDLDGLGTPHCATATLAAGENRTDVDFGYRLVSSLGDRVWYDANGNGIQDAGEAGLTGWTVTISGATLPAGYVTTQITGANGLYTFANLPAGTYMVCVTPQAGYLQTFDLDGLITPHCATVTLAAGSTNTEVDFGYQQVGSLGDRVWHDANSNGIQDAGEAGLTGWLVTISGDTLPAGYVATQSTGTNGLYTFTNLPEGIYTVCVTPQVGYLQTFDLDGLATANCATVSLAAGANRTDVDFGYDQPDPGAQLRVDIRKQVEGADTRIFAAGVPVPFTIVVTNNGTVPLTNVVVTDALVPACSKTIGNLAVNASQTYQCVAPAPSQGFTNTACVTAQGILGGQVEDCDTSSVQIPKIDIRKQVEGPDSRHFSSGAAVPFEIVVTNLGEVALSQVVVTDPKAPDCARSIPDLQPGSSHVYTCTAPNVTQSFTNTACVTGQGEGPGADGLTPTTVSVNDCDDSSIDILRGLLGAQGCSPGYWKQSQHFDSWTAPYTPSTLFADVFGANHNPFGTKTLLQVLGQGGGSINALGRHTVSALLNAAALGTTDYGLSAAEVISLFQAVYSNPPGTVGTSAQNTLSNIFENMEDVNGRVCPLN